MSEQHNGHLVCGDDSNVRDSAPPETGAVTPPHPQMYDIANDAMRPVAQEDYDYARRLAEEGQLRNLLVRKLLGMDRDKLQRVRKLLDDNMLGPR